MLLWFPQLKLLNRNKMRGMLTQTLTRHCSWVMMVMARIMSMRPTKTRIDEGKWALDSEHCIAWFIWHLLFSLVVCTCHVYKEHADHESFAVIMWIRLLFLVRKKAATLMMRSRLQLRILTLSWARTLKMHSRLRRQRRQRLAIFGSLRLLHLPLSASHKWRLQTSQRSAEWSRWAWSSGSDIKCQHARHASRGELQRSCFIHFVVWFTQQRNIQMIFSTNVWIYDIWVSSASFSPPSDMSVEHGRRDVAAASVEKRVGASMCGLDWASTLKIAFESMQRIYLECCLRLSLKGCGCIQLQQYV